MCNLIIVENVSDNYIDLLDHISLEIGKGRSCLFMEPTFVESPESSFLVDIESNCDHAADHLLIAMKLMSKLTNILRKEVKDHDKG